MSITTYAELIADPSSKKRALIEIEPSQQLIIWTNHAGDIYYTEIDPIHVLSVDEDGIALTEVNSLGAVSAGEWYYDDATNLIYVEMSGSDSPYQHEVVANYRWYACNDVDEEGGVIFNDRYYEPLLLTIPAIRQSKKDPFWGISITSQGNASFANADIGDGTGYFDTIFNSYAWINKSITILWGGEDLPYSEYKKAFKGIIENKDFTTGDFKISFVDKKDKWDTVIPLNSFDQTTYPDLDDEDVGKPIPWGWGIINRQPVVCVTRGAGTATNTHKFKIVDTSLHSIVSIDQVYVKGNNAAHSSADIAAATFKLSSTVYTPGDAVTVSYHGYESGTIIENPVVITRQIGEQISEEYTSTIWNQTDIENAEADVEEFPVGVSVTEFTKAIDVVPEIMRSCLGTFFLDNDGLYSINIWTPNLEEDLDNINEDDIIDGSLTAESNIDDIRKTIKTGWNKNHSKNTYSYKEKSTTITERLHGIIKKRIIKTLLSDEDAVDIYNDRISLLSKNATINISFKSKLQFSLKNIGDRATISLRRTTDSDYIPWMNVSTIEIKEIIKDFLNNTLTMTVDNLKGIGEEIGNWTADDVEFPLEMGGGSGNTWDPTWSAEKKAYALQHWGYWTDDDGFIDSSDSTTWNKSIWW
jgi:hypothetical protein